MDQRRAAQRVALLCNCGIDLDTIGQPDDARRKLIARRLKRLLERERIRGATQHWSYDLNRHIALKQALDEFDIGNSLPHKTKPAPLRRRS
ncbi:cytoplasmic protein [Aliihoeflea sp. PC F10.4]